MALTDKQRRFVAEYLIDLNATQAAIRAGYEFAEQPEGYYTYLLVDPRDGSVFYVGKGKGRRIGMHARHAAAGKVDNAQKHKRIAGIQAAGLVVPEVVFALHRSEQDAYAAEREVIEHLRDYGITNIVGGMVTNAELSQQQAKAALSRMKSFDSWVSAAKPYQIASAEMLSGAARACYDAIRNELRMIAGPC